MNTVLPDKTRVNYQIVGRFTFLSFLPSLAMLLSPGRRCFFEDIIVAGGDLTEIYGSALSIWTTLIPFATGFGLALLDYDIAVHLRANRQSSISQYVFVKIVINAFAMFAMTLVAWYEWSGGPAVDTNGIAVLSRLFMLNGLMTAFGTTSRMLAVAIGKPQIAMRFPFLNSLISLYWATGGLLIVPIFSLVQ